MFTLSLWLYFHNVSVNFVTHILTKKQTNNIDSSLPTNVLRFNNDARTSGHRHKLFINRCNKLVFKLFFIYRVVPAWNSLLDECFKNNSIQAFKQGVDVYLHLASSKNCAILICLFL